MTKRTTVYNTDNVGLYDTETGEIIETSNNKIITLEEFLSNDEVEDYEYYGEDITFIKSFRGNGIMLNKYFTNAEIAALVFLCDFICYQDCILRTNGNKKGNPLSIMDLSEIIDINYDTFRKTMKSLKKKFAIGYHESGNKECGIKCITVNPYLFMRGRKVDNWVLEFYKDSPWSNAPRQHVRDTNKVNKKQNV